MDISIKIINSILDRNQIKDLDTIYSYYVSEYLEKLKIDPFAYDDTDLEVKETLKVYLNANFGYNVQQYDIDHIYAIIKDYFY